MREFLRIKSVQTFPHMWGKIVKSCSCAPYTQGKCKKGTSGHDNSGADVAPHIHKGNASFLSSSNSCFSSVAPHIHKGNARSIPNCEECAGSVAPHIHKGNARGSQGLISALYGRCAPYTQGKCKQSVSSQHMPLVAPHIHKGNARLSALMLCP